MIRWKYAQQGCFELVWEGKTVLCGHAQAQHADGRKIDTRSANLIKLEELAGEGTIEAVFEDTNGLMLTECLSVKKSEYEAAEVCCVLSEMDGKMAETRSLTPLVVHADKDNTCALWKSIWTKMLLVPYDNTMWLRYEAVPLRAGRRSYDLSVLFLEDSREGLLLGAADFDVWKNAVTCSATDAKTLNLQCGVADDGTHDANLHGTVCGKEVCSSRFYILYGADYRCLLEQYGDLIAAEQKTLEWKDGVPFGINSWAGLAFRLNEENFRKTGAFLRDTLQPAGYCNQGVTYVNLDAGWHQISEDVLKQIVAELHESGQRVGIYDVPFAFFGKNPDAEIPGAPGHFFREILMRDAHGGFLQRVDGAIAMDVTHPTWKQQMQWKLDRFIQWGFDYVKFDFLSHGGMEGSHWDASVRTGRQALTQGYRFLTDCLSPEKTGRPFFISLSIAPLFPCGYGHARRFSCDAFGTNEDVEYVLNAQTYAWWQNGRLYRFNDPDHICLLRSFCMDRDSTEGEARARYTSAVIAGTVMMLSDDYEREEARERAKLFSGNKKINEIAAFQIVFCPVESAGTSASYLFEAHRNKKQLLAVFHWKDKTENVIVPGREEALLEAEEYVDLWSGRHFRVKEGKLVWEAAGCDALLLEECSR